MVCRTWNNWIAPIHRVSHLKCAHKWQLSGLYSCTDIYGSENVESKKMQKLARRGESNHQPHPHCPLENPPHYPLRHPVVVADHCSDRWRNHSKEPFTLDHVPQIRPHTPTTFLSDSNGTFIGTLHSATGQSFKRFTAHRGSKTISFHRFLFRSFFGIPRTAQRKWTPFL